MSAILIELMRITEQAPGDTSNKNTAYLAIRPALNHIADNYMQQFTIEELADMCHLSVTHFRRVFNSIMGTSPLDYLNNARIDQACIMLQNTDVSILDISESVGFHSVSSFNRAFSKVTDTTPREYRKKYNKGEAVLKKQNVLEYRGWL